MRHEFETRSLPRLLAATRRGFAFYVAGPVSSVHEFTLNDQATDSSLMQFAGIRGINAFVAMNKGFKCLPKTLSEENSFASIRVLRGRIWLAGILILFLFPNAFAQTDFSTFWKKFRSAVIAAAVAEMTKFPLSMLTFQKAVKNEADFLRRYNEIFKGEANASQCFASAKSEKQSARRYEIYCPFKETPHDWGNAPVRFIFELTKSGWKFAGLDNVNE
jgi:hypothetical protein